MAYFQKNQKHVGDPYRSNHHQQSTLSENNQTAQFKKGSQSKQSYLKAFKKYYIQKLLDKKMTGSDIQPHNEKENIDIQKTRSHYERQSSHHKSIKSIEKSSVMTDCTKKSRDKYTPGKISRSKIVNLVNHNQSELQEMLYNSITEVEREMMTFGDLNDLTRENKLLKCSISKLKQILKEKLEVALKKNKEELTIMFDQYSNMIKKLLEDKEILTNQLQTAKEKFANEQRKSKKMEESYQNQIKIIIEQNHAQIGTTKQQIEEFLDMIIQYEEEASQDKAQTEKLRERLVELQMENDRLKNDKGTQRNTPEASFNVENEEQLQKYALKIESLLTMLEQLQNQNQELNQFLKSCKCSRIQNQSNKNSIETLAQNETADEVKRKYERQLVEAEKQYIKEEMMLRQVLKKKDQCIDRLNLVIEQLRKARYASVDKMTDDAFMNKLILKKAK